MCTGFSHVVDAEKAKAAGIRAFATKPLTKREIAKTIRKVLDGRFGCAFRWVIDRAYKCPLPTLRWIIPRWGATLSMFQSTTKNGISSLSSGLRAGDAIATPTATEEQPYSDHIQRKVLRVGQRRGTRSLHAPTDPSTSPEFNYSVALQLSGGAASLCGQNHDSLITMNGPVMTPLGRSREQTAHHRSVLSLQFYLEVFH